VGKKVLITRIIPDIAYNMLMEAGFDVTVWEGEPMTSEELIRESKKK
jgi:predicted Fe-Mo cluster-binding NifX family protein